MQVESVSKKNYILMRCFIPHTKFLYNESLVQNLKFSLSIRFHYVTILV